MEVGVDKGGGGWGGGFCLGMGGRWGGVCLKTDLIFVT